MLLPYDGMISCGDFACHNAASNISMDKKEYSERFDRLYSNLLGACDNFYSWKGLQNKDYQPTYNRAKYFWSAVLVALQNEWLIGLAKCFEESRYSASDKVISVYALLRHHPDADRKKETESLVKKHHPVIASISRLRDHQLAHLNAEHLAAPSVLLQKFPINYGEVEDLINDFPRLFTLLNPEPGNWYVLDNYTKEPEREARYTIEKIRFYDQKEKEHVDRYFAGDVDNPFFPPQDSA